MLASNSAGTPNKNSGNSNSTAGGGEMKIFKTNQSTRRTLMGAGLGAGLLMGLTATSTTKKLHWRERALHGFGTTLWLRAAHHDVAALNQGLDEAIAAIRDIEAQMSLFDKDSDITNLNAVGFLTKPGQHLVAALTLGKSIAKASDGAFDPTVQSFWPLWANSKLSARIPTSAELTEAKLRVDWKGIQINADEIRFDRPSMQISLNGIAQGYAADYARDILKKHGVENALINTGEWSAIGDAQPGQPWVLGMADPHNVTKVLADIVSHGDSIATSADNTIVFTPDKRYHHVLNPKTGMSPAHMSMVTVIAPSCALADALTKVFFMQEFSQAEATAQQWGVKAILVDKAGTMKVFA
jgi:FAD:protein FMN transferase